jgi:hypothetical protein
LRKRRLGFQRFFAHTRGTDQLSNGGDLID